MEQPKRVPFTKITTRQKQQIDIARKQYLDLCSKLNKIKFNLESILTDEAELPLKFMMEFLHSANPEQLIKRSFVQFHNISIPGIRQEGLINSDLLDIDIHLMKEILDERISFDADYQKAKGLFKFDIPGLYVKESDEDHGVFNITDAFELQLIEENTGYASTDEEIKICEAVQEFADCVNNLMNLGLVRSHDINWIYTGPFPPTVLNFDVNADKPISLNKNLFNRLQLGMYGRAQSQSVKVNIGKELKRVLEDQEAKLSKARQQGLTNVDEGPGTVIH